MKLTRKCCYIPIVCVYISSAIILVWFYRGYPRLDLYLKHSRYSSKDAECPGVLSHMIKGYWKPLPRLSQELIGILTDRFRTSVARSHHIPIGYQMKNGKCGNIQYPDTRFRALCDPKGPTPCCYEGYCVSKSIEDCKCEECYDLRQRISAESSTWVPSHHGCKVEDFDSTTACGLLYNSTIIWIGNSFTRQMFAALTMILKGDLRHMVVKNNTVIESCEGVNNLFTWCQKLTETNPIVCNGTVKMTFISNPYSSRKRPVYGAIDHLRDKPRTMIFLGLGIHDNYNYTMILNDYIHPILRHFKAKKSVWPKFMWAAAHATGLLKNPSVLFQQYKHCLRFNKWLNPRLEKLGVPVFDTFNMTAGVASHDGCHYGMAVNMLKARVFIHYIAELQRKGQW
ncbi:hypothetical protein SNE40_013899 [Patella caerulea]|uniref:Uncharacterized protein n=1 Tax=Patella caerulea TaxID=87958 RepID=A0AAN8JFY1_PATCE